MSTQVFQSLRTAAAAISISARALTSVISISMRWSLLCGRLAATKARREVRFFSDGGFFSFDRKGHFIAPETPMLRGTTSAAYPLRLNTGRIRDQWHTMTRTGSSPRLGQHLPEPFVEIHPDDASLANIVDGGFARVVTGLGQCVLKAVVSERQQRGMLFAPLHWSDETSSFSRVGSLVALVTDPFSDNPKTRRRQPRSNPCSSRNVASCCRVNR